MFLATKVDQANKKHLITSMLCRDVKGAFDNVYKPRLFHTMRKMKLHPNVIRWVDSFLCERLASLSFNKDTEPMTPIQTGIPQGSHVSPIIFQLYLMPLFTLLRQTHHKIRCPSYIDEI
jgi:retron-type reverse transcriptase